MAAFPRVIRPGFSTPPSLGGPLTTVTDSGTVKVRAIGDVAFTWSETYRFKLDDAGHLFLTQLMTLHTRGTLTQIQHQSYTTTRGVGTGTPLTAGAVQTGTSINTDGWTTSQTGILIGGDLVQFGAITKVYALAADADSDGGGLSTLTLNPAVPANGIGTGADNSAVVVTAAVTFDAYVLSLTAPRYGADNFVDGITAVFREAT